MSQLKALVAQYAEKDLSVPVEFYAATGALLRGAIQRLDDDVAIVVTGTMEPMRVKINVKGLAGAANPQEWCLSRHAHVHYNELVSQANVDQEALTRAKQRQQLYAVFDKLQESADDCTYHVVEHWPNLLREDIIGFVSFNIHEVGHPLAGFLFMTNGKSRFVRAIPLGVELSPM